MCRGPDAGIGVTYNIISCTIEDDDILHPFCPNALFESFFSAAILSVDMDKVTGGDT